MIPIVNLEEKIEEIDKQWSPIEVVRVNDHVVRMALFEGEYHWHKHTNEDELFYVLRGSIIVQLKDQPDITLHEGEMAVIPRGVEHCPKSPKHSYILMFEPYVLKSCGVLDGGLLGGRQHREQYPHPPNSLWLSL